MIIFITITIASIIGMIVSASKSERSDNWHDYLYVIFFAITGIAGAIATLEVLVKCLR